MFWKPQCNYMHKLHVHALDLDLVCISPCSVALEAMLKVWSKINYCIGHSCTTCMSSNHDSMPASFQKGQHKNVLHDVPFWLTLYHRLRSFCAKNNLCKKIRCVQFLQLHQSTILLFVMNIFHVFKFCSWPQPQTYFNRKIFLVYAML